VTTLIVESDSRLRRILQRIRPGETRTSSTPRDGLLQASLWQPSVILVSDCFGDEAGGVELVRDFHARSPRSQVVVMAAARAPDVERLSIEAGAFGYVEKGDRSLIRAVVLAAQTLWRPAFVSVPSRLQ
jgi:DNA-binding NtrC family response regulator